MASSFINSTGIVEPSTGWRTYYIRIEVNGINHYKFGVAGTTVRKRYAKEPQTTKIELLKLWMHDSGSSAYDHEIALSATFPGDRPYIGRCGPLRHGGNTETYSHDVMAGEPMPHRYLVKIYQDDGTTLFAHGYSERNPKEPYIHLKNEVSYMDYAFGPEEYCIQLPFCSHQESVVIASSSYAIRIIDELRPLNPDLASKYLNSLKPLVAVNNWSDYKYMRFEASHPFTPDVDAFWVTHR